MVSDATRPATKDTSTDQTNTKQIILDVSTIPLTPINFENIPDYCKRLARWTVWEIPHWQAANPKPKKIIRYPNGDRWQKDEKIENHFGTFEQVKKACEMTPGYYPGFRISPDDILLFADMDGKPDDPAPIPQYQTYTERSAYGFGYHVLCWYSHTAPTPALPDTKEVYRGNWWIVFTGDIVDNRKDVNDLTYDLSKYTTTANPDGKKGAVKSGFALPDEILQNSPSRTNTMSQYIGFLRGQGLDTVTVKSLVDDANKARCKPPFTNSELEKAIYPMIAKFKPGKIVIPEKPFPVIAPQTEPETGNEAQILKNLGFDIITPEQIEQIRQKNRGLFPELPELPGFYKEHTDHYIKRSYAYPAFHFAGALSMVSLVIGRKAAMVSTAGTLFCNVFVMCCGQTTTSGKSTSNDQNVDELFPETKNDTTLLRLPERMSSQGFVQRLGENPWRFYYYDECSEFFNDNKTRWNESIVSNLCGAYDGRNKGYGLSRGGKDKVSDYMADNVYLTCLWNTTDEHIRRNITNMYVDSGFVPRFMWFWCFTPTPARENRLMTPDDYAELSQLQRKIINLKGIIAKIPIEKGVIFKPSPLIEQFRITDQINHMKITKENNLHNIATGRLIGHAYKIAMLFSLMDEKIQTVINGYFTKPVPSQEKVITPPGNQPQRTLETPPETPTPPKTPTTTIASLVMDIPDNYARLALKICETYLRPRMEYVITLAQNNDDRNLLMMILKSIEGRGGIATKEQVIQDTKIPGKSFTDAIEALKEGEMIEEMKTTTEKEKRKRGRPGTVYKSLKLG